MIGKFEELTLIALVRAGPNSYAAQVYKRMEKLEKQPQFAALYTALERLARKGMVETAQQPDTKGRRLYTISGEGSIALREALNATSVVGGFALPELGAI